MDKATKFITSFIFVLLILGALGLVAYIAFNSGIVDNPFAPFSVRCGEQRFIDKDLNVMSFPPDGEIEFTVCNADSYTVEILPAVTSSTDFNFTFNGSTRKYSQETDFSASFGLIKSSGSFTLFGRSLSASSLLSSVYGGSVDVRDGSAPVKIVVSSGGKSIEILLVQTLAIELSESAIVF